MTAAAVLSRAVRALRGGEALLAALLALRCAGAVAPGGGPPDTTPPEVIPVVPLPRALHVHEPRIALAFSKYVDRRSVEEAVFISPPAGELTYDWGSTDVTITLGDSLRPQTTYILTLGTDVVDTRQNHLSKAFALPFSTGDAIDSCAISGRVHDADPRGVMLFCYRLDGRNRDTLRPMWTKPSYVTQTGSGGTFTLPYLAPGNYRLLAVRDAYRDLVYDVQTDEFGAPPSDVVLSAARPSLGGIGFRLAREDTSAPFLSSAKPLDESHLLLRFNEALDPASLSPDSIAVTDTLSHSALPVRLVTFHGGGRLDALLITGAQTRGAGYRVTVHGIRDAAGNPARPGQEKAEFAGSGNPDTSKPRLAASSPAQQRADVLPADTVGFRFTMPVGHAPFEASFRLADSSGSPVRGSFVWPTAEEATFVPARPLPYGMAFRMTFRLDSLRDGKGTHGPDSTFSTRFTTIGTTALSSLAGTVVDSSQGGEGRIYLTATEITGTPQRSRTLTLAAPGAFIFEELPQGKYTLSAFRDADGNGKWSAGSVYPFRPAERFVYYPDTVKVRALWPVEGAEVVFGK